MTKSVSALALELPPHDATRHPSRSAWLYDALRSAIVEGRLKPSARLPATRDLARQYGLARGTVVAVYEQLLDEGYLTARRGAGTYVSEPLPEESISRSRATAAPSAAMQPVVVRPFRPYEPAVELFPCEIWARLTQRRWQRAGRELLRAGHLGGFAPLRIAIADYLGTSRGVRSAPEQVIVVTGTQQALDLVARLVVRPGDRVWIEDPGYPGARLAVTNAGGTVVGVPVDDEGLDVSRGRALAPSATLAYVTPAHQFPLGVAMSPARRAALLEWAAATNAYIVEDDYDSEFRWSSRPIPALQGEDRHDRVIFVGSFNKVLFTSLRIGYVVVPPALVDSVLKLRYETDRWVTSMNQAVLADFIADGHFGRHIRRARRVYAERLGAFTAAVERRLGGAFHVPSIGAGLATPLFFTLPAPSRSIEAAADRHGIEALALDRFSIQVPEIRGVLAGFGAFDADVIDDAMCRLAAAADACARGGEAAAPRPGKWTRPRHENGPVRPAARG